MIKQSTGESKPLKKSKFDVKLTLILPSLFIFGVLANKILPNLPDKNFKNDIIVSIDGETWKRGTTVGITAMVGSLDVVATNYLKSTMNKPASALKDPRFKDEYIRSRITAKCSDTSTGSLGKHPYLFCSSYKNIDLKMRLGENVYNFLYLEGSKNWMVYNLTLRKPGKFRAKIIAYKDGILYAEKQISWLVQ